jgi:5-methylcytosine-specific restriction protein A
VRESRRAFCIVPSAAPSGCKHPQCRALVKTGDRYCDAHKPQYAWQDRRTTAASRGYGARWQATRSSILRRDFGLCQVCKAAGKLRPAREVDHIVPKQEGGTDDDENLQAICSACHKLKTAAEAARGRGRSKVQT